MTDDVTSIRQIAASILALSLTACAPVAPAVPQPLQRTGPASILLISLDAFRVDYLQRGLTPNLARIAREGVRAEWMTPSYPSLTFPNHYTIVTGLRPSQLVPEIPRNAGIHRTQLRTRFQPNLVGEIAASLRVCGERVSLPANSVESPYE